MYKIAKKNFDCQSSNPEVYFCAKCGFYTQLKVHFKQHPKWYHSLKKGIEETDLVLKILSCRSCSFWTYSFLLMLRHKMNGYCFRIAKPIGQNCALSKSKRYTSHNKQLQYRKNEGRTFNCQESTPEKYFCSGCKFSTHLKTSFKEHIKKGQFYKNKSIETNFALKIYSCQDCSFSSHCSIVLLRHQVNNKCNGKSIIETDNETLTCVLENGINWYICHQCDYRTKDKRNLKFHILYKHTPSNRIQWLPCSECNYQGRCKKGLRRHMAVHDNTTWHKCDECEYKGKELHLLKRHIYNKHCRKVDIKVHYCDYCEYTTATLYSMKRHMYCKHSLNVDFKVHYCDQCDYKTTKSAQLKEHKIGKHKVDNIDCLHCNFCNYKTAYTHKLKSHIQSKHTCPEGIEWISCDQCDYKSKTASVMTNHKRFKHLAVKKFKCDHCEYSTTSEWDLKHHVLQKHTPDENINWFLCDQCEYRGKTKDRLKKHLVTHSLIRNFHCDQCDSKYKRRADLKRHIQRKHGTKVDS